MILHWESINLYQTLESFQTLLNARAKVPFWQVQWSRSLESSPRCVFSADLSLVKAKGRLVHWGIKFDLALPNLVEITEVTQRDLRTKVGLSGSPISSCRPVEILIIRFLGSFGPLFSPFRSNKKPL